jgi:hypothetical protein
MEESMSKERIWYLNEYRVEIAHKDKLEQPDDSFEQVKLYLTVNGRGLSSILAWKDAQRQVRAYMEHMTYRMKFVKHLSTDKEVVE